MLSINMLLLYFAFCFYALSSAKKYNALGPDPGGIDLLTHFSNASVPQRYLGMGLCEQPFNHTEELLPSQRCSCLRLCGQLMKQTEKRLNCGQLMKQTEKPLNFASFFLLSLFCKELQGVAFSLFCKEPQRVGIRP